jgi:hypothetical protein
MIDRNSWRSTQIRVSGQKQPGCLCAVVRSVPSNATGETVLELGSYASVRKYMGFKSSLAYLEVPFLHFLITSLDSQITNANQAFNSPKDTRSQDKTSRC